MSKFGMNENGLKFCPFCGSFEVMLEEFELVPGTIEYFVKCHKCRVSTAFVTTKENAYSAWNDRVGE